MNEMTLTLTEDEAAEFTLRVASESVSKEDIAKFFEQHSKSSEAI